MDFERPNVFSGLACGENVYFRVRFSRGNTYKSGLDFRLKKAFSSAPFARDLRPDPLLLVSMIVIENVLEAVGAEKRVSAILVEFEPRSSRDEGCEFALWPDRGRKGSSRTPEAYVARRTWIDESGAESLALRDLCH